MMLKMRQHDRMALQREGDIEGMPSCGIRTQARNPQQGECDIFECFGIFTDCGSLRLHIFTV